MRNLIRNRDSTFQRLTWHHLMQNKVFQWQKHYVGFIAIRLARFWFYQWYKDDKQAIITEKGMIILGCMPILCHLSNPTGVHNCSAYWLLKEYLQSWVKNSVLGFLWSTVNLWSNSFKITLTKNMLWRTLKKKFSLQQPRASLKGAWFWLEGVWNEYVDTILASLHVH